MAAGVYAVGRPDLTQHGKWMAAVLSCGEGAALSHTSAAALFGMRPTSSLIEVSDRRRDQVLTAAGLTPLRFTHWHARHEQAPVRATLMAVAGRARIGA